jgi:hypothetical protein
MSTDLVPEGFAPYHLVQLDTPALTCWGRSYDPGVLVATLDFLRKHFPENEWGILCDGGLLDDARIERKPFAPPGDCDLRTSEPKFKLKVLRRAA